MEEGKYVALYDIESDAIDKTLIEMLMATRKMEQRGRSTDLLKVTERVYYRQYAPPLEAPVPAASTDKEYLYVAKLDCCRPGVDERQFNEWYDTKYLPGLLQAQGAVRATRYELYRVLMIEQHEVPRYLTVLEVKAPSADQAMKSLQRAMARVTAAGGVSSQSTEGDAVLYLKIGDVRRT